MSSPGRNLATWTRLDRKRIHAIRTRDIRAITSIVTCSDVLRSDYRSALFEIQCRVLQISDAGHAICNHFGKLLKLIFNC